MLALTTLSYYYAGLEKAEFQEALQCLSKMGDESQKSCYNMWYRSIKFTHSPGHELDTINTVKRIEMIQSNAVQDELLYRAYHMCPETINFWLEYCVFPQRRNTGQYPRKIETSAWHLPTLKGVNIGFSGTNDNKDLLPSLVQQNDLVGSWVLLTPILTSNAILLYCRTI